MLANAHYNVQVLAFFFFEYLWLFKDIFIIEIRNYIFV